jgi:hypothetical protein
MRNRGVDGVRNVEKIVCFSRARILEHFEDLGFVGKSVDIAECSVQCTYITQGLEIYGFLNPSRGPGGIESGGL